MSSRQHSLTTPDNQTPGTRHYTEPPSPCCGEFALWLLRRADAVQDPTGWAPPADQLAPWLAPLLTERHTMELRDHLDRVRVAWADRQHPNVRRRFRRSVRRIEMRRPFGGNR